MAETVWNIPRRIPYLDGLRAFSIATVVLGHCKLFIPWFQTRAAIPVDLIANGRLGVRVFFVISGFLITTLLLKEMEKTGKISLSGFYERRIARIFPAFYTYIITIAVLAFFHVLDIRWQDLVTGATFTWNYGSLWNAGTTASGQVMGHLWTISLEEQFYLLWPACLILLGKRWAARFAVACVCLLPLVRLASYFLIPSTRGQIMGMFHTGADTILWGVVGAFAWQRGAVDRISRLKYRAALPWLSALVAFGLCPLLEARIRGANVVITPSLECASVMLFIFWLISGSGGVVRKALDSWPLVQLGLLSYSLYLWQELFILCERLYFIPLAVRVLCALVAAFVSYRFIEIPLRNRIRLWFSQSQPAH
ncbi:acyltransferase family protein [Acidicapsa ligni]|uniref:acyltransferase family protein n=1 Tax=Acidicapsa ligni TaxID=542300 RepID=UPI0021E0D0D0|nr:acyltransferase [Acidicapsa ligni]